MRDGDALPTVEKLVDQAGIERYAAASGDFNPIHIDREFAAPVPVRRYHRPRYVDRCVYLRDDDAGFRGRLATERQAQDQVQGACLPRRGRHRLWAGGECSGAQRGQGGEMLGGRPETRPTGGHHRRRHRYRAVAPVGGVELITPSTLPLAFKD